MNRSPSLWPTTRRHCLAWAGGAALWGGLSAVGASPAWAGGQLEEPLADSVRLALRAAVEFSGPPEPEFVSTDARLDYLRWLGEQSPKLHRRKPELRERVEFLQTVWYETKRAGLDASLVLGLIQVESAFRKFAISRVGASPTAHREAETAKAHRG